MLIAIPPSLAVMAAEFPSNLAEYAFRGGAEKNLADLVLKMLEWSPKKRISASKDLDHPCMQRALNTTRLKEAVASGLPHKRSLT